MGSCIYSNQQHGKSRTHGKNLPLQSLLLQWKWLQWVVRNWSRAKARVQTLEGLMISTLLSLNKREDGAHEVRSQLTVCHSTLWPFSILLILYSMDHFLFFFFNHLPTCLYLHPRTYKFHLAQRLFPVFYCPGSLVLRAVTKVRSYPAMFWNEWVQWWYYWDTHAHMDACHQIEPCHLSIIILSIQDVWILALLLRLFSRGFNIHCLAGSCG